MSRRSVLMAIGLLTLLAGWTPSSPARAQNVVVFVNGEPITAIDIEQRAKLIMLSTRKKPSRDEARDELINDKLKLKEAKKFGLELKQSDVDSAYASMATRMNLTAEKLDRQLESSGIRPETLKSRIKADFVWNQLVRGRFQQNLIVGERDLAAAAGTEGASEENFEYQLRPIVLVVPRGSAAAAVDARRREAEALRERAQSCNDAVEMARALRGVAVREMVTKVSADLPPNHRAVLDKTPVGKMTPPEVTRQGVEMVALCARQATTADTPKKREAREKLFAQKFEKQSKAYLADIRKSALIEFR